MLHPLEEFIGRPLESSDGGIGKIEDVYFDDKHWRVRYVVVDSEEWLGKKILLSPEAFRSGPSAAKGKTVSTTLTRERIRQSPYLGSEIPTREDQDRLHNYYSWVRFWTDTELYGPEAHTNEIPGHRQNDPSQPQNATIETPAGSVPAGNAALNEMLPRTPEGPAGEVPADTSRATGAGRLARMTATERDARAIGLHPLRKAIGYHVEALDGAIGHIDSFILDDDWYIRYAQVDTSNAPGGKPVLVATEWLTRADWDAKKVRVDMDRATIRNSPAYDPKNLNRDYETELYEYHRRPGYWRAA